MGKNKPDGDSNQSLWVTNEGLNLLNYKRYDRLVENRIELSVTIFLKSNLKERLVKAIRDCTLNSDHFQDELKNKYWEKINWIGIRTLNL